MTGPPVKTIFRPSGVGDFTQWTASGSPVKPNWGCVLTAGDPQFALFPNGGALPKRDLYKMNYYGNKKIISLRLVASAKCGTWQGPPNPVPEIKLLLKVNGVTLTSSAKLLDAYFPAFQDVEHTWAGGVDFGDLVVDSRGEGIQIGILNDNVVGNRLVDLLYAEITALPVSRKRYFGPYRRSW